MSTAWSRPVLVAQLIALTVGSLDVAAACSSSDSDQSSNAGGAAGAGGGASGPIKGGGKTGADAEAVFQKVLNMFSSNAMAVGNNPDGIPCDSTTEGLAWCADGTHLLYCHLATWWIVDCTQVEASGWCGYDPSQNVVSCYGSGSDATGAGGSAGGSGGTGGIETTTTDVGVGASSPGCLDSGYSCFDASECCSFFCDETGVCG